MLGLIERHSHRKSSTPSDVHPAEGKDSRNGWMRTSARELTALVRSSHLTNISGGSSNPCTPSSFETKNVFVVLQDLSEEIGGS